MTLSWDDPANDSVTGHRILRGLSSTVLSVLVNDTGSTATTYIDEPISSGTTYRYQVMALNAFGASPVSGTVSVTTPVARLAAPENFAVSFDNADSEIDFRWDAVTGADSYVVQQLHNNGTFSNVTNTSAISYSLSYSGTLPYSALYVVASISESERSLLSDAIRLRATESFVPVRDRFTALGTWNLTKTTGDAPAYNNYTMSIDSRAGNPSSALKVAGSGFVTFNTVVNEFDLTGLGRNNGLRLSVDMRITTTGGAPYPTMLPEIEVFHDVYNNPVASKHLDYTINSADGGWHTYTLDISGNRLHSSGSLIVAISTADITPGSCTATVYFDNFRLDQVAQSSSTRSSQNLPPPPAAVSKSDVATLCGVLDGMPEGSAFHVRASSILSDLRQSCS